MGPWGKSTAGRHDWLEVTSEIHKAVTMKSAVICNLVHRYQLLGGTCCLRLQGTGGMGSEDEDGGSKFFRNVGTYLPNNMASHPRTQWSSDSTKYIALQQNPMNESYNTSSSSWDTLPYSCVAIPCTGLLKYGNMNRAIASRHTVLVGVKRTPYVETTSVRPSVP
jgi:hypothetical protein